MAFADPQTFNAVSCPRTGSALNAGTFTSADTAYKLSVSHSYGKRTRRTFRVDHNKIAADPFSGENTRFSMSCYIVVDVPTVGYTVAEQKVIVDALTAYLSASTGAKVTQLLGGEN